MIQIIWEFVARQEGLAEFERCYSSAGSWAELFRRAPGYRGTTLLRDADQLRRFVTIDRWESAEAQEAMREKFAREYEALDTRCQALTESERRIGVFEGE